MRSSNATNIERKMAVKCSRWICAFAIIVFLGSCTSDPSDPDGGIIGTGVRLEGTAASMRRFASNDVEIKSSTGMKTTAQFGKSGRFQINIAQTNEPLLMRTAMGNGQYLYGIGHPQADGSMKQNIHSYSDATARNWFASSGYDIDSTFNNNEPMPELPVAQTADTISTKIQAIVSAVKADYGIPDIDLETVSFDADGTGVDAFLDNNSVLISDGLLSVLILDQVTQVMAQASTGVPITTDLTLVDQTPPDAPTSLRALAASTDKIMVVWDAATDNIGVTVYQVFRNGSLVATTPYTVYTDSNLSTGVVYSYAVVAVDSNGNRSMESTIALSETLSQPDNIAPSMPTSVVVTPKLNNIGLAWSHDQISDIAAFKIYRSDTSAGVEDTFKVTSNFMTDVAVQSGFEYCYQVSAIDSSGNESAESPVQCKTTLGNVVPDAQINTTPIGGGNVIAPTQDVSGLSCTQELNGAITTDTVIAAGCYLARGGISVQGVANLLLEQGVVIKFGSASFFEIATGASLTALGNATSPIVLSAIDPTPGFWKGVRFSNSNSLQNRLDFVQVEYAGFNEADANVTAVSSIQSPTRLSISNTTVRRSAASGFVFETGTVLEAFDRNLMVENRVPVTTSIDSANALNSSNRYSGNAIDQVVLSSSDVEKITRLVKLEVPYQAKLVRVANSLSIDPGVTLVFDSEGSVNVSPGGVLKALGTADAPILFTGAEKVRGFWDGIEILNSNEPNQIEHAVVEFAGGGTSAASLMLQSNQNSPSRLSAGDLILRESSNFGFSFDRDVIVDRFDNITSTSNRNSGMVSANAAHTIGPGASFVGNDLAGIVVNGATGAVDVDSTWLKHDAPYLVTGAVNVQAKLTLAAGTTLIMDADARISVSATGSLDAVGAPGNTILITGRDATPGYWGSIGFLSTAGLGNRLEYVVVEYGGGGQPNPANAGNIELSCTAFNPTSVSLENVMLDFSIGWGLFADQANCNVVLGQNVTYTGNAQGGFNLMP